MQAVRGDEDVQASPPRLGAGSLVAFVLSRAAPRHQPGKDGGHRFVLYQSDDGEGWGKGIIVSGDTEKPDGYSQNCIINKYDDDVPNELMAVYSIIYKGRDTNEYVYFIRPDGN